MTRWILATCSFVQFLFLILACGPAATPKAEFRMGFAALATQIPAQVGQPIEAERYAANGDSQQRTSQGLMVWRKADNWTAFTNGSRTWVNGPDGAVERSNDERFAWEAPGAVEYPIRGRFVDILVMDHQDPQIYSSARMATLARLVEKQLDTPVRLITDATEAALARAPADGYAVGYVGLPELVEESLAYGQVSARREFQPVALESLEPVAVAVPKDSRFKTLGEVVDAARLNPGRLRVRVETVLGRVAAGELGRLADTEFTLVRNGADPVDLEVQLLSLLLPGVKSGKLRPLAVMDTQESKLLPGTKTMAGLGYNLRVVQPWGYVVRAGTPPNVVEALSRAFQEVMKDEDYKKERQARLAAWGHTASFGDATEMDSLWSGLETKLGAAAR